MAGDLLIQTLILHLDVDMTYEKGAKLLSFLTYPEAIDSARRSAFHNALCHWYLRYGCETYPEDQTPLTIKPAYFGFNRKQVDHHVKILGREFQKRLIAGRMALAYLKLFKEGRIPAAFGKARSLSLNKIADFVHQSEGYKTPDNFETRIWRPSLPVIHISAALYIAAVDSKTTGKELSAMHVLADDNLLISVIKNAVDFRQTIAANPGFPGKVDQLIGITITA
jgi:hypothetical protein